METPAGRKSLIADVRRRQIIDAAADVIAAEGLPHASLSRIAARAGLSSAGLITYHFGDRRELLLAVSADVAARHLATLDDATLDDAAARSRGAGGELDRYIAATVTFQDRNRAAMQAAWQIVWLRWSGNPPFAEQQPAADGTGSVIAASPHMARLVEILERGQTEGDFRPDFSPELMARTINSAVLGYMDLVASTTDPDPITFTAHLQQTFATAVRTADHTTADSRAGFEADQ